MTESPNLPQSPIPLSLALSEASPMSLQELMASDPEGPGFADRLPLIVQSLREMAERFKITEEQGKRAPKAPKATSAPSVVATQGSSTDLDF